VLFLHLRIWKEIREEGTGRGAGDAGPTPLATGRSSARHTGPHGPSVVQPQSWPASSPGKPPQRTRKCWQLSFRSCSAVDGSVEGASRRLPWLSKGQEAEASFPAQPHATSHITSFLSGRTMVVKTSWLFCSDRRGQAQRVSTSSV